MEGLVVGLFIGLLLTASVFLICIVELFQRNKYHRIEILGLKDRLNDAFRNIGTLCTTIELKETRFRQALEDHTKVNVLVKLNGTSNNYDYQELDVATLVGLLMRDREIIEQDVYVLRGHKDE